MRERVIVKNHRDQPVELHLRSQVLVIAPGGAVEVDRAEATVPQLAVLARQRAITLHPAEATSGTEAPHVDTSHAEAPHKRTPAHKRKGKQTHSEGDE